MFQDPVHHDVPDRVGLADPKGSDVGEHQLPLVLGEGDQDVFLGTWHAGHIYEYFKIYS